MLKRKKTSRLVVLVVAGIVSLISSSSIHAQQLIKKGETIAFLGNSITQFSSPPNGYTALVANALESKGIRIKTINAGVSGNVSTQMLDREDADVISKKPDWMTLSCGVNDVWHGAKGVPLEQYKINITKIVDKAQAAGIKVIILTATMITEDQSAEFNQKLVAYNDFLRQLAKEKNCLLADLNADMQAEVAQANVPKGVNVLTNDGVHMNALGYQMMAIGILKTQGFTPAEIAALREKWMDYQTDVNPKYKLSVRQFQKLLQVAKSKGMSVNDLLNQELGKIVDGYIK